MMQDVEAAAREVRAGDARAARGELAAARGHYEEAIRLEPGNARFYCQLGACEWRLGRISAGACFEKAVELEPGLAVAHAALGSWYLRHGLVERANQASRAGMELSPDDGSVMQARAAVLEAIGELEEAW